MSQTTEKSKHQNQYDAKINDLSAYQTDEEKRLKQQNSAAREAASISHQKLMKYLPQQTAGYSVGMTETAKIAANNSLQRQLAEADAAYESSVVDLNRYVAAEKDAAADKLYERERAEEQWNYQKEQDQYQKERAEEQWNYQKEQDAAAKQAAKQAAAFDNAMVTIDSRSWNTVAELENYINGYNGEVSDTQWQELQGRLNYYKNNPEQQAAEESAKVETERNNRYKEAGLKPDEHKIATGNGVWSLDETGAFGLDDKSSGAYGDNFEINANGKIYEVERGDNYEADSNVVKAYKAHTGTIPKKGEIFSYNGKLYGYLPYHTKTDFGYQINYRIQSIESRDDEQYDALLALYGG